MNVCSVVLITGGYGKCLDITPHANFRKCNKNEGVFFTSG